MSEVSETLAGLFSRDPEAVLHRCASAEDRVRELERAHVLATEELDKLHDKVTALEGRIEEAARNFAVVTLERDQLRRQVDSLVGSA